MKNKIAAFLSLIALTTFANTIVTTKWDVPSQVRDIVKANIIEMSNNITYDAYPDAETVILDSVTYESYNTDGTSVIYDDTYTLILTEKGKRSESVASLHYNAFYGSIEIIAAEILQENGNTIKIDLSTHAKIMVDPGYMGANIYDPNDKILRISYPGLQVGDIVRLAFKRITKKSRIHGVWSDYQVFETSAPIVNYSYYISAPNALPIKCNLIRDAVPNTITSYSAPLNTDTNRTLHIWDIKKVPQYFPEPNMPPAHTVCQRLLLSTAAKWEEISSWYWNLSKPRLDTVTDEMRATVEEILAKSSDQEQNKIWNIYTWVSQNIRYMGVTTETEAPGYEPHNVSETFEKRYGVCRDKAALLVAMLRLAKIDAYPVLIHVGEKRDPQVPMTFFNHAIVGVREKDGSYTLMDPTNENSADLLPAYLAGKSYLVATPEGETLLTSPEIPASANMVFAQSKGKIESDGKLSLTSTIDFDGLNDSVYRGHLIRSPEEKRHQFFEAIVKNAIPGATLEKLEITPANLRDTDTPLKIKLVASANNFLATAQKATILNLPWLTSSIGYVNFLVGETGLEKRRFPFETEDACGVQEAIELTIESTQTLIAQPDTTSFKTNGITYNQRFSYKEGKTPNSVQINAQRRFEINQTSYSPAQYSGFKDNLRLASTLSSQNFILTSNPETNYDIKILSHETAINLVDNSSWTSTVSTVKEILTYAGRKNNSELKISYCPAWEEVELLEATVSNKTGQVHKVRPEEINIMDEGWVASAPRYPARRTLVVSLPGVEVGSIISTTYRKIQTKAPLFYYEHKFQGHDPILTNRLTLLSDAKTEVQLGFAHPQGLKINTVTNNGIEKITIDGINMETLPRESNLPMPFAYTSMAFLSSSSWYEYLKLLRNIITESTSPQNSKECSKLALELCEDADTQHERTFTIRNYVMRNLRLSGPDFTKIPLQATPADKILLDGYGNLLDRAILLSALLSEAGVDNQIIFADKLPPCAMTQPDEYPRYNYTNLDTFSYPLVKIDFEDDSMPIYLNDMNEYAFLGTSSFNQHAALGPQAKCEEDIYIGIAVDEGLEDMLCRQTVVKLDKTGDATCYVTNTYFGSPSASMCKYYEEMTPERLKRQHESLVGKLGIGASPIGDLVVNTQTYPYALSYAAKVPNYATKIGDTLSIPVSCGDDEIAPITSDNRKLPFKVDVKPNLYNEVAVILPKETEEVLSKPNIITWQYSGMGLGKYILNVQDISKGDRRTINLKSLLLERVTTILEPEFAKTVIEMNRKLSSPTQKTILIRLAK